MKCKKRCKYHSSHTQRSEALAAKPCITESRERKREMAATENLE